MLAKIAAFLLVMIGLASIYRPFYLEKLFFLPQQQILVQLNHTGCIRDALPEDVQQYGFLPGVDLIVHSGEEAFQESEKMRRLFLARHVATPALVSSQPDTDWVIASYPDYASGLAALQHDRWTVVKDCQNGIFLLKRR